MILSQRILALLVFAGASLQAGCSSHRLREGIWELSFDSQRSQNRLEFPIDTREVRILIERKDSGDDQVVEISDLNGTPGLEPMYGDIKLKEDGSASLMIDHKAEGWRVRFFGDIKAGERERVIGTSFLAVARGYQELSAEGRWMLRWRRDA